MLLLLDEFVGRVIELGERDGGVRGSIEKKKLKSDSIEYLYMKKFSVLAISLVVTSLNITYYFVYGNVFLQI